MNVAVFSRYRPDVDEYERVTVHGAESGVTFCGRHVRDFRESEPSDHPIDCERCLRSLRTAARLLGSRS